jgi:hypothetical protein
MRVLISVAIWGRDYTATFVEYSLASQLASQNIPQLASRHHVTYQIITTNDDRQWLRHQPPINKLEKYCSIDWTMMEDQGIDATSIPVDTDNRKYPFLSRLQNLAFERSNNYDALVFNYADFIWANGSLSNSIGMLGDDTDAVLSFCLPIDQPTGMKALDRYRNNEALDLPARELGRIAIDHLHPEARLRFWNSPAFTNCPTYLLWSVDTEGIVIRAYHQTVFALRVRHDDVDFGLGIREGTLDGYFTSMLTANSRVVHATDSDGVFVFSLYRTAVDTILHDRSREEMLTTTLKCLVTPAQRHFAEVPIRIKAEFTNIEKWEGVERESGDLLRGFHQTVPFDQGAYDRVRLGTDGSPPRLQYDSIGDWVYRGILVRFANSPAGAALKKVLGHSARKTRLAIQRLIYRPRG